MVPLVFGPVRTYKGKEETGRVLGAQLLTMLSIRRIEKFDVGSWEVYVLHELLYTFCRNGKVDTILNIRLHHVKVRNNLMDITLTKGEAAKGE